MTKIMTPDITDVMTNVLKSVCTLSCRLHASVLPRWLKKVLTFQSPCGICWSYLQFSNHKTQFVKGKLRLFENYSIFLENKRPAAYACALVFCDGADYSSLCSTSEYSGTLVMPPCFWVDRLAAVQAKRTICVNSSSERSEGDFLYCRNWLMALPPKISPAPVVSTT